MNIDLERAIMVLLFGMPVVALMSAVMARLATRLTLKFTPAFGSAFLAAYLCNILLFIFYLVVHSMLMEADGKVDGVFQVIMWGIGFFVQVAFYSFFLEHPETGPISYGAACLVLLVQALLTLVVAAICILIALGIMKLMGLGRVSAMPR